MQGINKIASHRLTVNNSCDAFSHTHEKIHRHCEAINNGKFWDLTAQNISYVDCISMKKESTILELFLT